MSEIYLYFRLSIRTNNDRRIALGSANKMEQFVNIVNEFKEMYEPLHEGVKKWDVTVETDSHDINLPPWLCQPYVRSSIAEEVKEDHTLITKVRQNIFIQDKNIL